MENKNIVLKIYEKTINQFLEGCDEEKVDDVKKMYFDYIFDLYKEVAFDERNINYYSKFEFLKWKNFSYEGKMGLISKDECLYELKKLSSEALDAVKNYEEKGIKFDSKLAKEKIAIMEELLGKVLEYNKDIATYYYSEGSLDFSYAAELSNLMSLRTGRNKN